jgi:signal peptidase I
MSTFRSAVADWNHVPTGSMEPTILIGDRIFVNKLAYDLKVPFTRVRLAEWGVPERGDLVVFLSPADGKRLVKRVIGVPGDLVSMSENRLIVNGQPAAYALLEGAAIAELELHSSQVRRYAAETLQGSAPHRITTSPLQPSRSSFLPLEVPPGQYFVMGDNRDESFDSRWFGFVEQDLVLGRATAIALSVDPQRYYRPRWHRFFMALR